MNAYYNKTSRENIVTIGEADEMRALMHALTAQSNRLEEIANRLRIRDDSSFEMKQRVAYEQAIIQDMIARLCAPTWRDNEELITDLKLNTK